ncbi:MAG TPA: DUF6600 domain-containing protein [Dokdonella sp.]|uniref:DUF6600 domain-containing protein n=1 Tax=Dokdonella sp. TaxID=2291710 RepID=UPI002D7F224B|nr:DUF6600 domain-containing protein [Dokdonella sp.]HET9033262.1 DUF6600 domain-containing protein [Dokdonella sp.]
MFNRQFHRRSVWLVPILLLLGVAGQALADPPSRVARLSYLSGDVSMQPAGIEQWSQAHLNRPLITGDTLYTDRASRVEMEIGAATVRLDERTSFRLLNLDDATAQIELTAGTLNLNVRRVFEGQIYEIDTPTLALVIDRPGQYRVDIAPQGDSTMVSVVDGDGDVYGRDNASFRVRAGESYVFFDSLLQDYKVFDLPRQDDFDRWCYERVERYERSPSRRYVSEEIIGYADLDDYGSWSTASSYGAIWYPSRVSVGWTPYRDGHWSWIDPWGWTWVDNAPWGFAPSHYGRWAHVNNRWGWVPGPRHVRPIYAPALVAFVGGGGFSVSISSGGPVGWFPLGPRDVYVPWYRGSRSYFNNINVRNTTIINNTYINNVYNDYSNGRPVSNFDYAYRNNRNAYTAVSHDAFVNARTVNRSQVQVTQALLSQGRVVSRVAVAPTARSFVGAGAAQSNARNVNAATFNRQVIARTAPPVRNLDAQERIRAISRNNNQPLAVAEMRQLSTRESRSSNSRPQRIEVVGGDRPSATRTPTRSPVDAGSRVRGQQTPASSGRDANVRPRTGADSRIERGRSETTPTTIRAPRSISSERATPTTRAPQPAVRSDSSRGNVTPRRSVDSEPTRGIPLPERRSSPTVRSSPAESAESGRRTSTPATQRAYPQSRPEVRSTEPRTRPPAQAREVQPRVAPQPTQRSAQPRPTPRSQYTPEPRSAQPRATPQPNVREAQPRMAPRPTQRDVQPRNAPRQQPSQPAQRPPARSQPKQAPPKQSRDDAEDDGNQRRRRE